MPTHTVKQGEHISRITEQYRFFDYHTIWDHANNSALKQKRQNPNVLLPGDQLFIPESLLRDSDIEVQVQSLRVAGLLRRADVLDSFEKPLEPNTNARIRAALAGARALVNRD